LLAGVAVVVGVDLAFNLMCELGGEGNVKGLHLLSNVVAVRSGLKKTAVARGPPPLKRF
jgi:hypothetical protein